MKNRKVYSVTDAEICGKNADRFGYIFSDYNPEQFKKLLERAPLSAPRINAFLRANNLTVRLKFMPISGRIIPIGVNEFLLDISFLCEKEERYITFVHEMIHPVYHVKGNAGRTWKRDSRISLIEKLIDNEAKRFYGENKEFVIGLFNRLLEAD